MMAETQLAILFTSIALVVIGLYAAIFVDNIIKKIKINSQKTQNG